MLYFLVSILIILILFLYKIKKQNEEIKELRKDNFKLREDTNDIKWRLFRNDYFCSCPASFNRHETVSIVEAKKFKKLKKYFGDNLCAITYYTTPEGYEAHKDIIKKWEKEVKEFEKKQQR